MFSLQQYYKYNPEWIENLIPFERDIYVEKVLNYINSLKKEVENN